MGELSPQNEQWGTSMSNAAELLPEPDEIRKFRDVLRSLPRDKRSKARKQFEDLLDDIAKAIQEDQHAVKKVWKCLKDAGLDVCLGTFNAWLVEAGVITKKRKTEGPET